MNISAGEFKAKCLKLMDQVKTSREEIIITKFGKPVAKLAPLTLKSRKDIFGCLQDDVKIHQDILEPIGEVWDAQR